MRLVSVILLVITPAIVTAQTAPQKTDPCHQQPVSQRQMNDCADFEYQQSDARLNKVYQSLIRHMSNDLVEAKKGKEQHQVSYVQEGIGRLKDVERVWLSYRDLQCKAAAQEYEGGSIAPMIYSDCLKTLTDQRIEALKQIYEDGDRKLEQ